MKNTRKSIVMILIFSMILSVFSVFTNRAYADEVEVTRGIVKGTSKTKYDFNKKDILVWAAKIGASSDGAGDTSSLEWPFIVTEVTEQKLASKELVALKTVGVLCDNQINASDGAQIAIMEWLTSNDPMCIRNDLAQVFNVEKDSIKLIVKRELPDDKKEFRYNIENGNILQSKNVIYTNANEILAYTKKCFTSGNYSYLPGVADTTFSSGYYGYNGTEEQWDTAYNSGLKVLYEELHEGEDYDSLTEEEKEAFKNGLTDEQKYNMVYYMIETRDKYYTTVRADAVLPDGTTYRLVIGNDMNWYLEKVDPLSPVIPAWETELSYKSFAEGKEIEGKMSEDGTKYLPPYYDDDNNKKDADATAYIKSKTDEIIISTNGVALTDENTKGNPNSEGWYYPDVTDKKVIAKDYPFDKYDNTNDNGIVKETVALEGGNGGKSSETPSIEWTFRRKIKEQKENENGTTTVTITYNLPVDPDSIPDGWDPIYDEDGKTIHKITRTFGVDENYDEDVTVKQNGTGVPNTTHVKVKARPSSHAKAGQNMTIVGVIVAIAIVAVNRFYKVKNTRKIK